MRNLYPIAGLLFWLLACTPPMVLQNHAGELKPLEEQSPDPKADATIAPYKKEIDAKMKEVLGESALDLPKVRGEVETLLGNFVADLLFESMRSELPNQPLDICLLNSGGLRASLSKGTIRLEDVFSLMPFDNLVVFVKIDTGQVQAMFNYLAQNPGMPFSGMRMAIADGNPRDMEIGALDWSNALESRRACWLVTTDFLAGGGDNMHFLANPLERIETGLLLRDIIADYIRKRSAEGKTVAAALDGRMRMYQE